MGDSADISGISELTEERIRLEREALHVERERLAAARAHAAEEAKLAARVRHPFLAFVSVALLTLLAFAGGLMSGVVIMERRQQTQREARLAKALSQLDNLAGGSSTNAPAVDARGQPIGGGHRNVSVVVIE